MLRCARNENYAAVSGRRCAGMARTVAARPARPMDCGERNVFRADLHAVLGVAAKLNAAFVGQSVDAFGGVHLADRVRVEQHHLADRMGADELAVVFRFVCGPRIASSVSPSRRCSSIFVYCGQASRQQPQLMHSLSG